MTLSDAQAEALRRWGDRAWVNDRGENVDPRLVSRRFEVGVETEKNGAPFMKILGQGPTWEDAFSDAALRTSNPFAVSDRSERRTP